MGSGRHIGAFTHTKTPIGSELLGIVFIEFVLGRTRQGHIARHRPWPLPSVEACTGIGIDIFANSFTFGIFQVHYKSQLIGIDTIWIHHIARRIGKCENLGTQLNTFFGSVLRYIPRSRNHYAFALQPIRFGGKHILCKIHGTVSRGFRADHRATPTDSFSSKDSGKFVFQSFVLAKHIANFSTANPDIPSRNIPIRTDMAKQLGHKALTKTHHFPVRFAFRIKVSTAFATTHG